MVFAKQLLKCLIIPLDDKISDETLNITTLGSLKTGEIVNLERALTLSSRLGGHIVSGHVDCRGKFVEAQKN